MTTDDNSGRMTVEKVQRLGSYSQKLEALSSNTPKGHEGEQSGPESFLCSWYRSFVGLLLFIKLSMEMSLD